jgi:hypothetical protein
MGTCGDTEDVSVRGGKASWSLDCSGGKITVSGWVKDTAPDGRCARVKATSESGDVKRWSACGWGEQTDFDWTKNGSNMYVRLYVS